MTGPKEQVHLLELPYIVQGITRTNIHLIFGKVGKVGR